MPGQLHHVSLTVTDLEASSQFYGLFGYRTLSEYKDAELHIVMLHNSRSRIELFHFSSDIEPGSDHKLISLKRAGITHFALSVRDLDDYHHRLSDVTEVTSVYEARLGGFRYFFCQDPDNNQVEVVEESS